MQHTKKHVKSLQIEQNLHCRRQNIAIHLRRLNESNWMSYLNLVLFHSN